MEAIAARHGLGVDSRFKAVDAAAVRAEIEGLAARARVRGEGHGCQMAISNIFLDYMCLALRAFKDYGSATLRCKI